MSADLGLTAFDTSIKSIELLIFIIKSVKKVRKLKAECDEVGTTCVILKDVLEANKKVLNGEKTAKRLESVLTDLAKFVAECRESNVLNRAWEILWRHRLPKLLKDVMTWIALLTAETTISARSDLWKLLDREEEIKTRQEMDMNKLLARLQILDDIKKTLDDESASPARLEVDFLKNDNRLVVAKDTQNVLYGELALSDARQTKVICEPIKEDLMRYGEKGPRHVLIYAQLSANTLVHPFYGIAERFDQRWAVMKDLRECSSLGVSIQQGDLPSSVSERLLIAHDIAKTVEYLHSVEVLVKCLSDKTVLLSSELGKTTPYLTNLEKARLFTENTSGGEYDVRYEAPEFQNLSRPRHSIYTDIWSVGILIWECVSGKFPFDSSQEVSEGQEAARIRQLVRERSMPWNRDTQNQPLLDRIAKLVDRCCSLNPTIRPSAADVSHSLLDILILATVNIDPSPPIDQSVKARVSEMLQRIDKKKTEASGPLAIIENIDEKSTQDLDNLASNGDATAAFLLGSAIWYGLATPKEDLNLGIFVAGQDRGKELRARSALPHLEFAFQAGVKAAADPLMRVHHALVTLYQSQVLQYRNMQSL